MGRYLLNRVYHFYSTYFYMKEWCNQNFKDKIFHGDFKGGDLFFDNCALAHINEHALTDGLPHRVWWDLNDYDLSHMIRKYEFRISDFLLGLGLILNVLGINIYRKYVVYSTFWINLALAAIYTFEYTRRFGVDFAAYMQQASAVYQGQTDYTKISSN